VAKGEHPSMSADPVRNWISLYLGRTYI